MTIKLIICREKVDSWHRLFIDQFISFVNSTGWHMYTCYIDHFHTTFYVCGEERCKVTPVMMMMLLLMQPMWPPLVQLMSFLEMMMVMMMMMMVTYFYLHLTLHLHLISGERECFSVDIDVTSSSGKSRSRSSSSSSYIFFFFFFFSSFLTAITLIALVWWTCLTCATGEMMKIIKCDERMLLAGWEEREGHREREGKTKYKRILLAPVWFTVESELWEKWRWH